MTILEKAAAWMEAMAADDSHGYDQAKRWGPDYDCSSLVISAFKQAGIPLVSTYTGNMLNDFLSNGFEDVKSQIHRSTGEGLERGDVLLNEKYHTAMYLGNGMICEAAINENGEVKGGRTGDQTGNEIHTRKYYNYPWEHVLRLKEDREISDAEQKANKKELNIIDISDHQRTMDLPGLFASNPDLDGVVVKTTGGIGIRMKCSDAWIKWLIANDKPFGFYHYINDDYRQASAEAEAKYFVEQNKDYFGKGIPFADYEANGTWAGGYHLLRWLDKVYELTGVKPGVYCSKGRVGSQGFKEIAAAGYPLWIAQYANYNPVYGFQEDPWQSGSVAPFEKYWMHQYTSCGYLPGYASRLDFDKFYGTVADWNRLAGKKGEDEEAPEKPSGSVSPKPGGDTTPDKKTVEEMAREVLDGKWGNGNARKNALIAAGYDYDAVQKAVNELVKGKETDRIHELALDVIRGKYGKGLTRRIKLGSDYAAVQAEVNRILLGR